MKLIEFKNNLAQRIYLDYIDQCKSVIRVLSDDDQEECLMEVNSYIYEYLQDNPDKDEILALKTILERIGSPAITMKEVVAHKKIDQALQSYKLNHLLQALWLNLSNGIAYVLLFIMTLLLLCFPIVILMKVLYPHKTGLFVGKGIFFMGMVDLDGSQQELLGQWFIPVVCLLGLVLYFVILVLLRFVRNKK